MRTQLSLGAVSVVFGAVDPVTASKQAAALGFEHIDVMHDVDPETLAVPVGIRIAYPDPRPNCLSPPPWIGEGSWDDAVAAFRAAPGSIMEPHTRSVVHSLEMVQAMAEAVPGLKFCIDTGHIADWGEDPLELLPYAANVQLRQGCPGQSQLHVDDPAGVVDFAAVLRRLDELGYTGVLSIEHFDLPDLGWPLEDPVGWATDLAAHVRAVR